MKNYFSFLFSTAILSGLLLAAGTNVSAQGRSGGRGGSGRPSNPGVNSGLGTASQRSGGRSDSGLGTASQRSNGRLDAGLGHARKNVAEADRELQKNPNLPHSMKTNANDLRAGYQTALAVNPDLKFGQFVAANMISRNLSSRYAGVTTNAILGGLANGDSIGQTLKNLGVSSSDAKASEKKAQKDVKGN